MNWEDESYVRLYKRDTITWKLIGWQGRCVLPLLLRKVDRAGCAELEGAGMEGIAALIDVPLDVVELGVNALILRGVIELRGDTLVFPKFMAAHEARQSDKLRQKESRARRREATMTSSRDVTENREPSHGVTNRDDSDENVTMRSDEIRSEEKRKDESPTGINTSARTQAGTPKEHHEAKSSQGPSLEPNRGHHPDNRLGEQERQDLDWGIQGRSKLEASQDDNGNPSSLLRPQADSKSLTLLTVWPLLVERIPWLKPSREYPNPREGLKGEITTGLPGSLHTSLVAQFVITQKAIPPVGIGDFEILCDWATSGNLDYMQPSDRRSHICNQLGVAIEKARDWHKSGRPIERGPPKRGFVPQPERCGDNLLARLTKRKP